MIPIIQIIVIMIKSTVVRMRSGVMRNMKEKMVDLVKMTKRMIMTRMFSMGFLWYLHDWSRSSENLGYKECGVERAPAGGNIKRSCTLEKGYFGAGWEYGKNMKGYEEQR